MVLLEKTPPDNQITIETIKAVNLESLNKKDFKKVFTKAKTIFQQFAELSEAASDIESTVPEDLRVAMQAVVTLIQMSDLNLVDHPKWKRKVPIEKKKIFAYDPETLSFPPYFDKHRGEYYWRLPTPIPASAKIPVSSR